MLVIVSFYVYTMALKHRDKYTEEAVTVVIRTGSLMSPESSSVRQLALEQLQSVSTEVWTFHYLNHLCWERTTLGRRTVLKKQLTVFITYFSGGVSLGGMGLRCKPHRERAGNDRRKG